MAPKVRTPGVRVVALASGLASPPRGTGEIAPPGEAAEAHAGDNGGHGFRAPGDAGGRSRARDRRPRVRRGAAGPRRPRRDAPARDRARARRTAADRAFRRRRAARIRDPDEPDRDAAARARAATAAACRRARDPRDLRGDLGPEASVTVAALVAQLALAYLVASRRHRLASIALSLPLLVVAVSAPTGDKGLLVLVLVVAAQIFPFGAPAP
jgi:hypothetical protein